MFSNSIFWVRICSIRNRRVEEWVRAKDFPLSENRKTTSSVKIRPWDSTSTTTKTSLSQSLDHRYRAIEENRKLRVNWQRHETRSVSVEWKINCQSDKIGRAQKEENNNNHDLRAKQEHLSSAGIIIVFFPCRYERYRLLAINQTKFAYLCESKVKSLIVLNRFHPDQW